MTEKMDKDVIAATAAVEKGGSSDDTTTAALKEMGYKQEFGNGVSPRA